MSRNHYRGYTVLVALVLVWVAAGLLGAQAGWKGRGLWASSGTRAPWHQEGGRQNRAKLTKFQLRPNPLAR